MKRKTLVSLRAFGDSAAGAWGPVVLWAIVISGMSTDEFGGSRTLVWVAGAMRAVWPSVSFETILAVHFGVRKLAHLVEYAVLAALLVRAFRSGTGPAPRSPVGAAILVAALYSLVDEGHQALSSVRTGAIGDCVIDSLGAALGGVLTGDSLRGIARRRSRPCTPSPPP